MGLMILIPTHRDTQRTKPSLRTGAQTSGTQIACVEMSEAPQKSASNVSASCAADLT